MSREQALIREILAPLSMAEPGAVGLADDAAALAVPAGTDLVVTKDMVVAGVHFLEDDPPDLVARKALRVNLSDLAAKGADPWAYFLGLALPGDCGEDWIRRFAKGLAEDQALYGCVLAGGDLTRTGGALTISVTATGTVPSGRTVRRNTARAGDAIFVTGTIGDAVLGLARARGETVVDDGDGFLLDRYRLPRPRVALAPVVREFAHAAMDVSDGLAGDLALMCEGAGVGARVTIEDIPLSAPARAACDADSAVLERLVCGGDDYEILCAIPPGSAGAFSERAAAVGVEVAQIGVFDGALSGLVFLDRSGHSVDIASSSYSHF